MDQEISIDIPNNAKVAVSVGMPLGLTSTLYTISDTEAIVVPICKPLRVKPDMIFQLVTHVIGDTIKQDEVLAQKKQVFGTKKIRSPISGTLTAINHTTGEIVIEVEKTATQSYTAPIEGIVTAIDTTRQIIKVSLPKGEEIEVEDIGKLAGGEASYLQANYLSTDISHVKDKVVIIETISPAAASKFEVLDAIALVYLEGSHSSNTPHARVKTSRDFEKLVASKKKKVILLPKQKKIIAY